MPPTTPKEGKATEPTPIRVRAVRTGFYQNGRKRPGDEFTIASERELGSWMEKID